MHTIIIGFSKPKKMIFPIGSWLIRLWLKTPYSHTYMKFYSESLNREIVYEAVGSGVRFIGLKQWTEHAQEIDCFTVTLKNSNYITLMQYCIDHSGFDYGFMQNIGIFLADIFRLKNNPFKKGLNCSEQIAKILSLEGYKFDKPFDLITPKDIYQVLISNRS